VLAHQPPNALVIGEHALVPQGGADPAPAVRFELVADGGDRGEQRCLIESRRRRGVVGRARDAHQLAPPRDGDAAGPMFADVGALLGGRPER